MTLAFLLLTASLQSTASGAGVVGANAAQIEKEVRQPSAPLTEEQVHDYTERLARSTDANAVRLDLNGDLRRMFAPYFDCYRTKLDNEHRPILRNVKVATIAFGSAFDACSALRSDARTKAIEFASSGSDLSPTEREQAVDYYRQWQGQLVLKDYFAQKGLARRFSIISAQLSANQQRNR